MQANLTNNYFELFALPVGFQVDNELLALRYRELQRALHPDRFVNASDQERRLSVQQAARVNEGFRVLKSPLARARYLLELHGLPIDDTDTTMEGSFLMEQMELREALGEVRHSKEPFAALERVRLEVESRERLLMESVMSLFQQDNPEALEAARKEVRKMQFMQRLLQEVEELEEELVHHSQTPH